MQLDKSLFFICFILISAIFSCSKDSDTTPEEMFVCNEDNVSYSVDIKPIFTSTCAISGCHVNNFAWGNFNEYLEIKSRIQFIVENVFDFGIMPPSETNGPENDGRTIRIIGLLDPLLRIP